MKPILHCIHLEKRTDRLQSFLEQMNQQMIPFRIWDGVTTEKMVVANISLAHKKIVRYAKEEKLPYIIICEDDIIFTADGAWKYFLQKMPKIFDLYCGVVYAGEIQNGRIVRGMSGTNTLYAVHENFYDTFLSTNDKRDLDGALGKLAFAHNYYACIPHVVKQIGDYSDHFKRKMNYRAFEEDKIFFGL